VLSAFPGTAVIVAIIVCVVGAIIGTVVIGLGLGLTDHDTISTAHGQPAVIANNVVQHLSENLVKPHDGKPDSLKML